MKKFQFLLKLFISTYATQNAVVNIHFRPMIEPTQECHPCTCKDTSHGLSVLFALNASKFDSARKQTGNKKNIGHRTKLLNRNIITNF